MTYPVSACFFIRNNNVGAFCAYETMAMILPLVSEMIVLDLESNDGTWEILQDISRQNRRVKIFRKPWPHIDAGVFADLANELVEMCHFDKVWYFQADEVPHQDLIPLIRQRFDSGLYDLSFWRIQYRENFQKVKWFPHLVHRVGIKGRFNFVGDGMTTDRTWDAKICSDYGGEFFPRWGGMGDQGIKPYVSQMLMDVSAVGGFRDNIIERRQLHAPFWHEEPTIEGKVASQWVEEAMQNANWTKEESPFNLPAIMRYHVGKVRYEARPELIDRIKDNNLEGGWK